MALVERDRIAGEVENFPVTKKDEIEEITRLGSKIKDVVANSEVYAPVTSNATIKSTQEIMQVLPKEQENPKTDSPPLASSLGGKPNSTVPSTNLGTTELSNDKNHVAIADLESLETDLQKKRSLLEGAKEDLSRKLESASIAVTQWEVLLGLKRDYHPHHDGTRGSNGHGSVIYFRKNSLENRVSQDGFDFDAVVHFGPDFNIISSIVAPSWVEFEDSTYVVVVLRLQSHRIEVLLHSSFKASSKFLI